MSTHHSEPKKKHGPISRRDFLKYAAAGAGGLFLANTGQRIMGLTSPGEARAASATGVGTGTAVYAYPIPPENFDPHTGTLASAGQIDSNVYDALFGYSGFPPVRQNDLCERFDVSGNGLTYTFRIRKGVKFHDGAELKASDVLYSFKRIIELKGAPSIYWEGIVRPEMLSLVDDYTLRVRLEKPYVPLPDTLAWLYVVNEKQVQAHVTQNDYGNNWLNTNDAGSGPFKITSYQPAVRLVMERFPNYWRGWGPRYLNGWVMDVIREPATIRLGLEKGTAHLGDMWALTVDDFIAAEKTGMVRIAENPAMSTVNIKMNNQKAPTNNRNFRKAAAYAFDYDAVVKNLLRGRTERVYGAYPKGFRFYKSFQGTNKEYKTDLDRARSYLAQSGFDPKNGPVGYIYRGDDPLQRDYGLILKSSLAKIGVNVELQGATIPVMLERAKRPQDSAAFYRISNSAQILDPDLYVRTYLWSKAWEGDQGKWYSVSFYKNPQVDRLIESAQHEANGQKRKTMYEQLQDIVWDDAVDIWVDQQHWMVALSKKLQGYQYTPLGLNPVPFRPMYFEPPVR